MHRQSLFQKQCIHAPRYDLSEWSPAKSGSSERNSFERSPCERTPFEQSPSERSSSERSPSASGTSESGLFIEIFWWLCLALDLHVVLFCRSGSVGTEWMSPPINAIIRIWYDLCFRQLNQASCSYHVAMIIVHVHRVQLVVPTSTSAEIAKERNFISKLIELGVHKCASCRCRRTKLVSLGRGKDEWGLADCQGMSGFTASTSWVPMHFLFRHIVAAFLEGMSDMFSISGCVADVTMIMFDIFAAIMLTKFQWATRTCTLCLLTLPWNPDMNLLH